MFWLGVPSLMFIFMGFFKSCRVGVIGKELENELISKNESIIYAHWHRYAPLYLMYGSYKKHVIMSSHKDSGELGARCMKKVGIETVRGAPKKIGKKGNIKDRRGKVALLAMGELMKREGFHAGLTVDGPSGPAFVLKKGTITLAKETGFPIVVLTAAIKRKFTILSWDKMWFPLPFTKIIYFLTGPFFIPHDADDTLFEECRLTIENHMKDMAEKAERYWNEAEIKNELPEPS
jgi:lysophospholipid acyltransferase (LPLAT)-like uncharacterized protein